MKKILFGMIMAAMVLAGCRKDDGNLGYNSETTPEEQSSQTVETATDTQTEVSDALEPATQSGIKAEFSHDEIYIALELPSGWKYEIVEYDETQEQQECGIIFWTEEHEDLRYELFYHSFYGICGTGVTIEELQLENGTDIWRYSENIQGTLWCNIKFEYDSDENDENDRGSYVLDYSGDEKLVMEYEDELQEILETVIVGR